jgi:hypothetical protein
MGLKSRKDRRRTGAALGIGTVLVVGIVFGATPGWAQRVDPRHAQLTTVPRDRPDLTGQWAPETCGPDGATCPFVVADQEYTAWAESFMASWDDRVSPRYDCVQATMPSLAADPYSFSINQLGGRVIFEYEKDDITRTAWLVGEGYEQYVHEEPTPYDYYLQGHSHAYYDGDTLVVESSKYQFNPDGLEDYGGVPSSQHKYTEERYSRDINDPSTPEDDRLVLEMRVEDDLILEKPIEFRFEYSYQEQPLILPYACQLDRAREHVQYADPKQGTSLRDFGGIE